MRARRLPFLLAAAACCAASASCSSGDDLSIQGAGATFPAPIYKRWFLEYYQAHPDVRVNYQAIGSGAGIRRFTDGLVDFGASDAAMNDAEIKEYTEKHHEPPLLLPMTAGSVAVCYNVPGAPDDLRLSRQALVAIFLGQITNWNDSRLAADNPTVALPDLAISTIHRAEGSGTTYAFTNHLATAHPKEWGDKKHGGTGPGAGKSVVWPGGLGAKGNDGVAALIQQTPGAIGYVEFGYADLTHLPMARVENKAGNFVQPTRESGLAALEGAKVPEDLRIWVPDPPGKGAYPIVTYTWVLCRRKYQDARVAEAIKDVLRFALGDGQKLSAELGYLPLPKDVGDKVRKAVDRIATP
jgi:phosphate transport system substrate-binding protein